MARSVIPKLYTRSVWKDLSTRMSSALTDNPCARLPVECRIPDREPVGRSEGVLKRSRNC